MKGKIDGRVMILVTSYSLALLLLFYSCEFHIEGVVLMLLFPILFTLV
jgi:hypothetical protein